MKILLSALISSLLSSCGVAIYEHSDSMATNSGRVAVFNDTYRNDIEADFSLAPEDSGYVASLTVAPGEKEVRSYRFDSIGCDSYAAADCQRKVRFYRDGDLMTYCRGRDIFKTDYLCNTHKCEPLDPMLPEVDCYHLN